MSDYKVQSIIVKKSNPKVHSRLDATRIAKHYGPIRTSRETSTSYRFRQVPPTEFVKGSFRTKKVGKVTMVLGRLK